MNATVPAAVLPCFLSGLPPRANGRKRSGMTTEVHADLTIVTPPNGAAGAAAGSTSESAVAAAIGAPPEHPVPRPRATGAPHRERKPQTPPVGATVKADTEGAPTDFAALKLEAERAFARAAQADVALRNAARAEEASLIKRLAEVRAILGTPETPESRDAWTPRRRKAAATASTKAATGEKRARRSSDDLAKTLATVVAAVKKAGKDGARADTIREATGLDRSALPRVLRMGVTSKVLKTHGKKRGTLYFAR
jgi:hypothetical protein